MYPKSASLLQFTGNYTDDGRAYAQRRQRAGGCAHGGSHRLYRHGKVSPAVGEVCQSSWQEAMDN